MIYVTASDQLVQYPMVTGLNEGPHQACLDCVERAMPKRRMGERIVCYHVLHHLRHPLDRAPRRTLVTAGWRQRW